MNKVKEILLKKPFVSLGVTLVIGLFIGWLFFSGNNSENLQTSAIEEHEHTEGTIWTCSMHPQIREDAPGHCPICGMELVPLAKEGSENEMSPGAVVLSESAMKIADVQTSVAEKKAPYRNLMLPGKVKADERRIHEITAHFPGRIEKLLVNFTGQKVRKGQVLATIFSPELVTAQKELYEAIKYKETNPQFYEAARNKLKLWLITDEQINGIEQSGQVQFYFKILSPASGTVTKRNIAQGDHVKEGMSMFQIIDLRHVWVEFDAYESDIPWVKTGSVADITINSIPGKIFKGKVTFIDPVLDDQTRTTTVRAELDNKQEELRPGMFAQASIQSMLSNTKQMLMVPKSAVLWTGKRAVVYVKETNGNSIGFNYREITLGESTGSDYVVVKGLQPGEEVVTNGAFKIDAAAQLKGTKSMMNPEGGKVSTGMAGMDMGGDEKSPSKTEDQVMKDSEKDMKMDMSVNEVFKKQLTDVYKAQLKLQEAFFATDEKLVKRSIPAIKSALTRVDMGLVKGEMHIHWMNIQKKLTASLESIKAGKNIEQERLAYADFNDTLYSAIKMFGTVGETIYYQFCPMAREGNGAYWLSPVKEIKNPYYGEAMPTCGENKEIIN